MNIIQKIESEQLRADMGRLGAALAAVQQHEAQLLLQHADAPQAG